MIDATLCFLTEGEPPRKVLLGFKKRGFGQGKYAGYGGKIEPGESPAQSAARELAEESGISIPPERLRMAGHLSFLFPAKAAWNQTVHIFQAPNPAAVPVETAEMTPTWFALSDIPWQAMWHDNRYWLPAVLEGESVNATFIFKPDNATVETAAFDAWAGDLALECRNAPGGDDAKILHESIKAFNNETSPYHRAGREPEAVTPLNFFIRDQTGAFLGGLTAETFWGWLSIDDLWLDRSLRGRGLGSKLIRMAEEEAIRRGCKAAQLQTFSFQASGFYEKQGYRVVGEMRDYPPGESFFWMRKDF